MHRVYSGSDRTQFRDYYIHEPTMLRDQRLCMPMRWYMKGDKMWVRAYSMRRAWNSVGDEYWQVEKDNEMTFDESLLFCPVVKICGFEDVYNILSVDSVQGDNVVSTTS